MTSIFTRNLRNSSYKGVPFHVATVSKTIRRRKVLHEYPQRDIPYVEDLGQGATMYKVSAFLVGDDCDAKAQRLEKALLSPGPGAFIHPVEGALTVTVFDASSISYSSSELRYCSLDITFVEAGELSFPHMLTSGPTMARQLADKIGIGAVGDFVDRFKQSAVYSLVQSAINGTLLESLGVISSSDLAQIFDVVDEVTTFAEQASGLLLDDPRTFADKFASVLGLSRFASTQARWTGIVNQIAGTTQSDSLNRHTRQLAAMPAVTSDIEAETLEDSCAIETLTRGLLLANAVGASTLIGTDMDVSDPSDEFENAEQSEEYVTTSVDEILDVRDQLLAAIDAELENPFISDSMFMTLLDARSVVFSNLTTKAEGLSRLLDIETPQIEPALVLAYDYYDDSRRFQEIVTRNKVKHAAFCPSELRILSK